MTEPSFLGMKIMYVIAMAGAGMVGVMVLLAPALAQRYIFAGSTTVTPYLRILGALWLALGVVAAFGLSAPLAFSPVLLIQLIYKSVWLTVVAYPALMTGNREPGLVLMAALFTIWVIALTIVTPFDHLMSRHS